MLNFVLTNMPHLLPRIRKYEYSLHLLPPLPILSFLPRLALSNGRGRGKHGDGFAQEEQNEDDEKDKGLRGTHSDIGVPLLRQAENDTVKFESGILINRNNMLMPRQRYTHSRE
jgi:hypothetical protein